jgi:hypothetical protein
MRIYRTNSVLELSTWDDKKRAFIRITPGLDGAGKGQPKPGEQRFDYDKTCSISFKTLEMFQASFKFLGLSQGVELELKKFGDMSKSVGDGDAKRQLKASMYNGKISIMMNDGDNKASITIEADESYAIAKWFEVNAQRYAVEESIEDEARKREAVKNKSEN